MGIAAALPVRAADTPPVLRLGLLQFGTVNWEQDVIAHHDLARDVTISVTPLANPEAGKIALLGGSVDAIVSDWLWVSRQRHAGHDIGFAPYSRAVGALLVPETSPLTSLADLPGSRLGVVGGPLDKNWLVLQAFARQQFDGLDIAAETEIATGAPPLLNKQMEGGSLDGILTYWHFAARLKAQGHRELASVPEAMTALGIGTQGTALPAIGYVFDGAWAAAHPQAVAAFLDASFQAKRIMATSDTEWERLRPLTRAGTDAELLALRDGFRAGIPPHWTEADRDAARALYDLLSTLGGPLLVGPGDGLADGTFLPGLDR